MNYAPCEKHEITNCHDCANPVQTGRTRSQRRDLGPWLTAQYSGTECSACEECIHQGDQIRSDGEGGWLCEGCGNLA